MFRNKESLMGFLIGIICFLQAVHLGTSRICDGHPDGEWLAFKRINKSTGVHIANAYTYYSDKTGCAFAYMKLENPHNGDLIYQKWNFNGKIYYYDTESDKCHMLNGTTHLDFWPNLVDGHQVKINDEIGVVEIYTHKNTTADGCKYGLQAYNSNGSDRRCKTVYINCTKVEAFSFPKDKSISNEYRGKCAAEYPIEDPKYCN